MLGEGKEPVERKDLKTQEMGPSMEWGPEGVEETAGTEC